MQLAQILVEVSHHNIHDTWLDLWKSIQITQELKYILLPNIKATL